MHQLISNIGNLYIVLFSLISFSVSGQTSRLDSLKNLLDNHKNNDTGKVNLINKIAYTTYANNSNQSFEYAIESYNLSKELNYTKGQAESLWLQGISIVKSDPEKSIILFKEALHLAKEIRNMQGVARYTNAIGTVYYAKGQDSIAVECYNTAIEIARKNNYTQELGKYYFNLSSALSRMGKIDLANKGYSQAINVFESINDKSSAAMCYNSLGNLYTSQSNYLLALECYHKGLAIREETRDTNAIAKSLISIGGIYLIQKNYTKALEYNHKAVEIAKKSNDKHTIAGGLLNIGSIYLETNDKRSIDFFDKALEISKELNIISLQIAIYLNYGELYYNLSELDKSFKSFENALELSEITKQKSTTSFAKLQIAKIYFAKNDFSNALKYAQSSLEIAENLKLIKTEKDLHELLSNIYAKNNNYKNAYIHSQLFKQLSDSIFNENNIRQLTELEFTYKFEKEKRVIALEQQKEFAVMVAKKKQQLIIIIILAISVILVSLLALYINRLYRFKNSANIAINKLEQEKKNLLEKEIERINLELEQHQKSLALNTLKLSKNTERDTETVKKLEAILESTTPENRWLMLDIIASFKKNSRSSSWNEFELLFQNVHNSFYENINNKFPDLTANERKLCAFLKLNMSSKDIANITFQSEEALKKARQRLRQKLGIGRDTNLNAYIQNI